MMYGTWYNAPLTVDVGDHARGLRPAFRRAITGTHWVASTARAGDPPGGRRPRGYNPLSPWTV
eukprot:3444226-Pleurochrysis_carterae.AAC.1